ncbi:MAG: hypothetical protein HGA75_05430 [Thiobacillus sp.]|nr:hypothetical protein [Thiobacillus sp.]
MPTKITKKPGPVPPSAESPSASIPQPHTTATSLQIVYADQIVNIGVSMSVSRLTLALETAENSITPFAQLVIPTPALFEALEVIAKTVMKNDQFKQPVIEALDAFRLKLLESTDSK